MHLKFLIRIISYFIFKSLSLYPSNSYRILIEHLFGKSFKFTERATTDRFIVIKYYVNVLRYKIRPLNKLNDNKILIFDNNSKAKQLRIDFLSYYLKTRNFSFISYEDLCFFETKFEKIIFIFISIPFIFIVFISSQFFKYKSSLALFIEYSIVISNLLKILNKNNQLRKIYYFSIFERESNFFSNEIVFGPVPIQLDSRVSIISSISFLDICGLPKTKKSLLSFFISIQITLRFYF